MLWMSQATKIISQDEWSTIKKVGVLKIQDKKLNLTFFPGL